MYLLEANGCPELADVQLTDVSSKEVMEGNGWKFDISHHKPSGTKDRCGSDTWYGYKSPGNGWAGANFTGFGNAILTFGNCFNSGKVQVFLNGVLRAAAERNVIEKRLHFNFHPKDFLLISEFETAIIKINLLSITCPGKTCYCIHLCSHKIK